MIISDKITKKQTFKKQVYEIKNNTWCYDNVNCLIFLRKINNN